MTLSPDPVPSCTTYTDGSGIPGGTYYGQTGKKAGQLVGGSGDNIVFVPGTYCFSTVTISGGGLLTVNGPVVIKVTGQSIFGGGGVVNTTHLASNLQIMSSYTGTKAGLTINGGSQAYMQAYAPDTEVVLGGGDRFLRVRRGGEHLEHRWLEGPPRCRAGDRGEQRHRQRLGVARGPELGA